MREAVIHLELALLVGPAWGYLFFNRLDFLCWVMSILTQCSLSPVWIHNTYWRRIAVWLGN